MIWQVAMFVLSLMQVDCEKVSRQTPPIAVCIPRGWFVSPESHKMSLFACSRPDGRCVTGIGSFPLDGVATLTFVELDQDESGSSKATDNELRRFLNVRRFLEVKADVGGEAPIGRKDLRIDRYVCLENFDAYLENGIWEIHYVVWQRSGGPRILMSLEFNADDARKRSYIIAAERILSSLKIQ